MDPLLRTGRAMFPDYKASTFSEWRAVTLLRHDTLLFARQSWLSCKAATLIPQAGEDSPSRKGVCSLLGLANGRGTHQPEEEGSRGKA